MVDEMSGILATELQIFPKQKKGGLLFWLFCSLASVLQEREKKNGKSRNQVFWEGIYAEMRTASKALRKNQDLKRMFFHINLT